MSQRPFLIGVGTDLPLRRFLAGLSRALVAGEAEWVSVSLLVPMTNCIVSSSFLRSAEAVLGNDLLVGTYPERNNGNQNSGDALCFILRVGCLPPSPAIKLFDLFPYRMPMSVALRDLCSLPLASGVCSGGT